MPKTPEESRREYVASFASTMVDIWRERLVTLRANRTLSLYRSVASIRASTNTDATAALLQFRFNLYGVYVQTGVGREVYRGNPGDIGRAKVRQRKEWLQPKYAASVHNIREYFAQSLSKEAVAMVTTTLTVPAKSLAHNP